MAVNKAYNQYRENSVFTSSPEELTLILYNGLIKFIMRGRQAVEEKDITEANHCIIRAQEIITEFRNTLDKKIDISKNLDLIYDYMNSRLVEANIKKDGVILEEVLGFAKQLRDTWSEAMKLAKRHRQEGKSALNA
jgi:flagellar protein FliS